MDYILPDLGMGGGDQNISILEWTSYMNGLFPLRSDFYGTIIYDPSRHSSPQDLFPRVCPHVLAASQERANTPAGRHLQ